MQDEEHQPEWSLRLHDAAKRVCEIVRPLHPTFQQPLVILREPPFQMDRLGWGMFKAGIEIKLKPDVLEGKTWVGSHHLSFEAQSERAAITRLPVCWAALASGQVLCQTLTSKPVYSVTAPCTAAKGVSFTCESA